ncbi:vacuolar ATPase assembly integral membrane protein vma21 [Acrasis kona]|uniref:Vacuolar ATPase assembly integral membrane protein vma21 n=1 Tax=Acrasis kona TaxID=1008807 RepID=A0AAW2YLR3_9EUKA
MEVVTSLFSVVLGYVSFSVLTIAGILVMRPHFPDLVISSRTCPPIKWAIINILQSFIYSAISSMIATYSGNGLHESWGLAVLLVVVGIAYLFGQDQQPNQKHQEKSPWYHILTVAVSVIGVLFGECLFNKLNLNEVW